MTLADTLRDLDWLTHIWPDLHEARLKGTPRTYLRRRGGADRTIHPGEELVTVGGMPAPLHLDVLDLVVELLSWADETAEGVAQALGRDRLEHATSTFADARPYLRFVSEQIPALWQDDPGYAESVADETRAHAGSVARALGFMRGGMTLDCACPDCHQPRVLTVVARDDAEPLIVCMGQCWLDADQSGHLAWRGRRAWPQRLWSKLAQRLCDHPSLDRGLCETCGWRVESVDEGAA